MVNLNQYWLILQRYKEGLIIGALTGLVAAHYVVTTGYDLNNIVTAGKGLLDTAMGRSAPLDIAMYKLYGTFTFVGAAIGLAADLLLERTGLYKYLRFR